MTTNVLSIGYRQSGHGRQFLTGRSAIFIGILALHCLAILALSSDKLRDRLELVAAPVQVVILAAEEATRTPPPIPPRVARLPPVDLVLPAFDLPADAPVPAAISVVPPRATSAPVTGATLADVPLVVDVVDYVRAPRPSYPASAKVARVQGVVMLRVMIDRDGHPRDVRVHRSSGSAQLDAAARDSLLDALFKPYRENGEPRSVMVIIPIEFSLKIRTASGP